MNARNGRHLVHLNSQPRWLNQPVHVFGGPSERLAVAISSETGAGAVGVAEHLARYLDARAPSERPWRVFNKNLILKVLEEHRLPLRFAKFLHEDTHNPLDELMDELFGLHPPASSVVPQSIETVRKLAREGNVIFVGWGVNAITAPLKNVFHVRLIGSLERRVVRIQDREHLDRKRALAFIEKSDRGRERYMWRYFHSKVSNMLLYDLVLNTDRFSEVELAHLIGDTALSRHSPTPARTVPVIERIA